MQTQGMRFLHASNPPVVHADLKSSNLLVDSSFRVKVSDFGLSQKRKIRGAVGTPYFMSPELLRMETEPNSASDVYAFGITLYEIFSRKHPYEGEEMDQVLKAVADVDLPEEKRPGIPENCPAEVVSIMTSCWHRHAAMRPSFQALSKQCKQLDLSEWTGAVRALRKRENVVVARTTDVLFDMFPKHIAEALVQGKKVKPEHKECVTIFFSDIVGYTVISSNMHGDDVSDMLDRLYSKFDNIANSLEVFKVETIGDAYVAVTNMVSDQPDHAVRMAHFARKVIEAAQNTVIDPKDLSKGHVQIRVGLNSGPITASVVGTKAPRYCLFGDTMNVAARMESTSQPVRRFWILPIYVCVFFCVCACVCERERVCVCVCLCTNMCMCVHACVCFYSCVGVRF
jgi:class 3 adenylate cyclase